MEKTIAEKLEALEKLQNIDSQLDEITILRGDLPREVQDLEDEIIGLQTRVERHTSAIQDKNEEIAERIAAIKESESLIIKYEEQQNNVRNNREFEALSKEIELQQLEMQISEKKIKQFNADIEQLNQSLANAQNVVEERKKDYETKKIELKTLEAESSEQEEKLLKKREKAIKVVDDRLTTAYEKLRKNAVNGLAVVNIKRNACGGCFHTVPPQRQSDVASKKKIIVCENCGRIFVDLEVVELIEKPKRRTSRKHAETENEIEE